jgi:hypothetical protein
VDFPSTTLSATAYTQFRADSRARRDVVSELDDAPERDLGV